MSAQAVTRRGETFSGFTLPAIDGSLVQLESYRGRRNLVVVFAADTLSEPPVSTLLEELLAQTAELEFEVAQVLVAVTSPDMTDLRGLSQFPVLLDAGGHIHRAVAATDAAGRPAPAVFVTDRFREIYAAWRTAPLPGAKEILDWLVFINIQCPECGVPEWPSW